MPDKIFADTNILVYAFSKNMDEKKKRALEILDEPLLTLSTQVIREFIHVGTIKYMQPLDAIVGDVRNMEDVSDIIAEDMELINKAIDIHERYKFSFYDCLIIAAAITDGYTILYSEDMRHGQVINGTLIIINPFLSTEVSVNVS